MLKFYVDQLLSLEPSSLPGIAFLNEPLANLLTAEQKQSLYDRAQECGKDMAVSLRQQYGSCPVERLVELCGGKIHEIDEKPDRDYTLFAYFEEPDDITVNRANVEKSEQLIREYQLEPLAGVSVRDLLLCHELYHLLESRAGKDSFVQQKHVCAFRLGKFHWMRRVGCLEEIAAMAFATELLQLPCSPYVFNIIMVYAFHPEQAAKLMADYTRNEGS